MQINLKTNEIQIKRLEEQLKELTDENVEFKAQIKRTKISLFEKEKKLEEVLELN